MAEQGGARPARATRGKRISELVGEDLDADEEFWNQKAFQEEAEDVEYAAEGDVEDVFDSDFDDDDDEQDNEEATGADEKERPTKRRLLPPGAKKKSKKAAKVAKAAKATKGAKASKKGEAEGQEKEGAKSKASKKSASGGRSSQNRELSMLKLGRLKRDGEEEHEEEREEEQDLTFLGSADDATAVDLTGEGWGGEGRGGGGAGVGGERRKSMRRAVIVRDMEREAMRAAREGVPKAARRKKEGERRWTQEEMLLEAAQTEILNREALEIMLAREEEVKRKAVVEKAIFGGPQIRFHSKDDPVKPACVVTGLPAKYRDPLSGQPYATIEAFKILRQRWQEAQAKKKQLNKAEKAAKAHARDKSKAGTDVAAAAVTPHERGDSMDRPIANARALATSGKGRVPLAKPRAPAALTVPAARVSGSRMRMSM